MPEELSATRKQVRDLRGLAIGGIRAEHGELGGVEVVLLITGVGPSRARRAVAAFLESAEVDRALVLGIAGGLTPDLVPGALVAATSLAELRGDDRPEVGVAPPPDPSLTEALLGLAGVRPGALVSSFQPLLNATEKRRARERIPGASSLAADQESASIAHALAARQIPYGVLRVISDGPTENLPSFFRGAVRPDGSISRPAIIGRALLWPPRMGTLIPLARRLRHASALLAEVAVGFAALTPSGASPPTGVRLEKNRGKLP